MAFVSGQPWTEARQSPEMCLHILAAMRRKPALRNPKAPLIEPVETANCPWRDSVPMFPHPKCCDASLKFDVLKATATDLAKLLDIGQLTSREIVQTYLLQVNTHNREGLNLNALIDVGPEEQLLAYADMLDSERKAGHIRSRYHGIPIIVKASTAERSISSPIY